MNSEHIGPIDAASLDERIHRYLDVRRDVRPGGPFAAALFDVRGSDPVLVAALHHLACDQESIDLVTAEIN